MKILTKKGFVSKLIIVLLAVILFSAIVPTHASYAVDDFGGKLLKPIVDLLLALGDLIMDLLHKVVYGMNTSILKIDLDNGILEAILIALIVIAAVAAVVAVGWGIAAAGAALLTALGAEVATIAGGITVAALGVIVTTGIETGVAAGMFARSEWFSSEAALPIYKISPEEIFTGQIELLNPNFFSKREVEITDYSSAVINTKTVEEIDFSLISDTDYNIIQQKRNDINNQVNELLKKYGYTRDEIDFWEYASESVLAKWENNEKAYQAEKTITITSEDAVSGAIEGYTTIKISTGEWQGYSSISQDLKGAISKWYNAVRNLALVAMMIILLYLGIRIMFCGVANEKAKYKNMLVDWVVGICLIFVMHYIMVFAMNITESIVDLFASVNADKEYMVNIVDKNGSVIKALKDSKELKAQGITEADIDALILKDKDGKPITDGSSNDKIIGWDARNIMGVIRVQAALENVENTGSYLYIGYVMCFLVLVWYTLFFFVTYLRRILYLAFFTIIAPLVAMSYPLDKLHDGKAQAFDMWLKEYIYNLVIQPMHLLLYTVLINAAFELASKNILYTLVAIGFMMPAEKFVRKMFGFDKAQTPGFLGGAAGAAFTLTAFNRLLNRRSPKGGGKLQGGSGNKEEKGSKAKYTDNSDIDAMKLGKKLGGLPVNVLSDAEKNKKVAGAAQKAWTGTLNSNKYNYVKPNVSQVSPISLPKTEGQKKLEEDIKKAEEKAKSKKSIWGGIKGASKEYAKQRLKRLGMNMASGKPIRDFARVSRGLAVGAGTAMLGATLGIAAEDPNKILQYGGTLGAAGYALGSRDSNSNVNEETIQEEFKRGLYGSDEAYRQAMLEEQRKQVIANENNLRKLRENLRLDDLKEARDKLQDYGDCVDAGITDMDDIATIVKLVEEQNWDKDTAKTAAKYYKKAGERPSKMGPKEKEKIKFQYSNIVKANGVTNQSEIDAIVDNMIRTIDTYGNIKDNLTEV